MLSLTRRLCGWCSESHDMAYKQCGCMCGEIFLQLQEGVRVVMVIVLPMIRFSFYKCSIQGLRNMCAYVHDLRSPLHSQPFLLQLRNSQRASSRQSRNARASAIGAARSAPSSPKERDSRSARGIRKQPCRARGISRDLPGRPSPGRRRLRSCEGHTGKRPAYRAGSSAVRNPDRAHCPIQSSLRSAAGTP